MSARFRKGDVVTIQATVRHDFPSGSGYAHDHVFLDIAGHHAALMLDPNQLTLHRPHISPGDWVQSRIMVAGRYTRAEVLAVHGDLLWVKPEIGDVTTWKVASIDVIDAPPQEVDAPLEAPLGGRVGSEEVA